VDLFLSSRANVPFLASGCLQIIETGGTAPLSVHNRTEAPGYLRPTAQVTARAGTYPLARALAKEAYEALYVTNIFINSGWYLFIRPLQEPFDGVTDERGQARVYFNVRAERRP
jgi:hypothetical protein